MAYRKFFYGDTVAINHKRYPIHTGHTGLVIGTRITRLDNVRNTRVAYSVDCECGKRLTPKASHMDFVATPDELPKVSPSNEFHMKYFLRLIGVTPKETQLEKQVEARLSKLKDRDRILLVKRFGLKGNTKTTHREIGEEFGVTRARIQHLEKALLKKLQR